ncbi:MAG: integrin alpha [Candidatus Midichloria sp.]|nr:integrin alpha [Candidatus Midichloria sp.]
MLATIFILKNWIPYDKSTFKLSSLLNSTIFARAINGITAGDYAGMYAVAAGDMNGDGISDLTIGADGANPGNKIDVGQSYVVFGKSSFTSTLELSSLNGTNGFTMNGIAAGDYAGHAISQARVLYYDAPNADPNGKNNAGQAYVVFGQSSFADVFKLSSLRGNNGFTINGIAAGDLTGLSVATAGDIMVMAKVILLLVLLVLICHSAGRAYVVFGRSSFTSASDILSSLNGDNGLIINGISITDIAGYSVAAVGDIDGDGNK